MKKNRLMVLVVVILVIWNVILTSIIVTNKKEENSNQTNVNEVTVTGFSTDLTKVIEQSKSSVVVVETNNALSSGIIYGTNENSIYVVTTCHGVADASIINVVFASGASYEATLVGQDVYADIAVLEVKTNVVVNPIKLGNSDLLNDGEFLVAIGTPKNSQYSFSNDLAIVSSKLRTISNSITYDDKQYEYYEDVIQLSSNVAEGYSGAPVLNMEGEVQGLIIMKDDVAVFALPINEVRIVADNIINEVAYAKTRFGFKGQVVSGLETYEKNQLNIPLDINYGLYISLIRVNSIAANAGLRVGDVVLSINGNSINSYTDLLKIAYSENKEFSFEVVRNNDTITLLGNTND